MKSKGLGDNSYRDKWAYHTGNTVSLWSNHVDSVGRAVSIIGVKAQCVWLGP